VTVQIQVFMMNQIDENARPYGKIALATTSYQQMLAAAMQPT